VPSVGKWGHYQARLIQFIIQIIELRTDHAFRLQMARAHPLRRGEQLFAFYDAMAGAAYRAYRRLLNKWFRQRRPIALLPALRCTRNGVVQTYREGNFARSGAHLQAIVHRLR
jgi:hypothetical protein